MGGSGSPIKKGGEEEGNIVGGKQITMRVRIGPVGRVYHRYAPIVVSGGGVYMWPVIRWPTSEG